MERQISGDHADYRHIEYVGAERQDAAVLKDQRLDGEDGDHNDAGGRRPERVGKERASDQMSTGGAADGEIDHLGGEDKCAHYAKEWNFFFFELPLGSTDHVAGCRYRGNVESGPDRS